jgi:hypothetical protein
MTAMLYIDLRVWPVEPKSANLEEAAMFAQEGFSQGFQYPSNPDYQQPGSVLVCILGMHKLERTCRS